MRAPWWFLPLLLASQAFGQITNGSFETGNLTGWTVGGTGRVQVISASGVSPNIPAFDGSYYAVLSTGPGNVGGAGTSVDGEGGSNDYNDYDVATLSQTFTVTSVPLTLTVAVMWLTSEGDQAATYDDLFDADLNGFPLFRHSTQKASSGISPWPDFGPTDGSSYTFTAAGPIKDTSVHACTRCGRTGWITRTIVLMSPGSYTLRFRVADQGRATYDSALAVDAVSTSPFPSPSFQQLTAASGVTVEWKGGGLEARLVDSRELAAAENPEGYAFISSGNLTGDNPGAQEQVFYWTGGTTQRLTAATSGSFSHPAVTSNGRWVVFASTANLTGSNVDGNWEIFRVDRTSGTITQITNTTAPCENRFPVVAGDTSGYPVAFVSNCGHGSFSNPDGNDEVVVWHGSGFQGTNTTGCQNYAPSISRSDGRYLAFVSTCNIAGANPDGNPEIFRWDRTLGSFANISNSTAPVANDTPAIAESGIRVAFVSNGNFTGQNADGSYEVFFWDNGTLRQLSSAGASEAYILARLSDNGAWALGELLDLASYQFAVRRFATNVAAQPGTILATSANPLLPVISRQGGNVPAAWQSPDNPLGLNPDGNQEIFRHDPGLGPPSYLFCQAVGATIPDNNASGVSSSITVPTGLGQVLDVDVWFAVSHARVGDLNVFLTSPPGTTRQLLCRITDCSTGSCAGDNLEPVLDDAALLPVQARCGNLPAVSGFYQPYQALSAFNGQLASGTWQIRVADRRAGTNGTFQRWCLAITAQ